MELTPKPFQQMALEKLRGFLGDARLTDDPAAAFGKWAPEAGRSLLTRYRPLAGMPEVPTVCLRLPTGGGKTMLAAMAVGVIAESYLERTFPMVLWLVPSDAIRQQTLKALREPDHPYRRALGAPFGGQVRVFDIAEFTQVRPQDLRSKVCVVVGTMQTLRVANTEGRRAYAHNENLEGHFNTEALRTPGLELIEGGKAGAGTPKFSFANLLKVQRAVVILDEAHQFVTDLATTVRQRIGPSVVLELTATPDQDANVLYRATAAELKAAEMIKLPVVLTEHVQGWQDALCEANKTRKKLAALAIGEPEYVRPLLLVQAQNAGQEADWQVVKKHLMEAEGLLEREIAVHTGDVRELEGVNLFARDCPVTTVITVQALREGWDCSFAYVLCSVANMGAAQEVEQLLGRVLRMPYAQERRVPELNKAYAHATSARFGETALQLRDGLVQMFGLAAEEAAREIEQPQALAFPEPARQVFRAELPARPLLGAYGAGMRVEPEGEAGFVLTAPGPIAPEAVEKIVQTSAPAEQPELRQRIAEHNAQWSPAERGVRFRPVPQLTIEIDGERTLFDADTLAEAWDWSLLDHPAELSRFAFDESKRSYSLDLEGQMFTLMPLPDASFDASAQRELLPNEVTAERLVAWLDPRLRDPSMNQTMLAAWILRAVEETLAMPGFSVEVLDRGRFVLLRKLREEIARARAKEAARAYQELLFGTTMRVVTSEQFGFHYSPDPSSYTASSWCEGRRFEKHYYARVGEMKDRGEECDCAEQLDRLPEVRHWVRNLAGEHRAKTSFWLQTKTDRFYPDFVAELKDGRLFAVEYKGESYRTNEDSREKETLGKLWAERSGGRAVFAMVHKQPGGRDLREQLREALAEPGPGLR